MGLRLSRLKVMKTNYLIRREVGRADLLRVWQPGPPAEGTIWKEAIQRVSWYCLSTSHAIADLD